MDETWILLDASTGLHVGWYFWLRVLDEVNRSARYGSPFALLLLEAVGQPGSAPRLPAEALARVPAVIRSTDLGGVVGTARAGVLLPQQNIEAAAAATRRVLERLDTGVPRGIRWDAKLLCYPQDGAEISNLLTSGWSERRPEPQTEPAERRA